MDEETFMNESDAANNLGCPTIVKMILEYHKPGEIKKLLDIGCGSGKWTKIFAEYLKPQLIIGLDVDKIFLNHATTYYGQIGKFIESDLTMNIEKHPNFKELKNADLIVSTDFIHMLPVIEQREAAIKNMSKLLSTGKMCIISSFIWTEYFAVSDFLRSPVCLKYYRTNGFDIESMIKLPLLAAHPPAKADIVQEWQHLLAGADLELIEISIVPETVDISAGIFEMLETYFAPFIEEDLLDEFTQILKEYIIQRMGNSSGPSFVSKVKKAIIFARKTLKKH